MYCMWCDVLKREATIWARMALGRSSTRLSGVEPNQLLSTAGYAQKGCQNVGADLFPTQTILIELLEKEKNKLCS